MDQLPQDPFILLSWTNTMLRDRYGSLEELCDDLDISREELEDKLRAAGFTYSAETNRFL